MKINSDSRNEIVEIRSILFSDNTAVEEPAENSELWVTNAYQFADILGVEAPSRVEVNITTPLRVLGFLNGTSDFCAGAAFHVDGRCLGKVRSAFDLTPECELEPGLHVLETFVDGAPDGCHTVWGFEGPEWIGKIPPHYLAIGAVCQDLNDSIAPWVRHHIEAGASHIYILCNENRASLEIYMENIGFSHVVTVGEFPEMGVETKTKAYCHILQKWGAQCTWIALIDVNEFIIPKIAPCLVKTLSAFEEYGALMIPALMLFSDSSGEDSFVQPAPFTDACGTSFARGIVRPLFVEEIISPHQFVMMSGRPAVGELFDDHSSIHHIQINHYISNPGEICYKQASYKGDCSRAEFHSLSSLRVYGDLEMLRWRGARDQLHAPKGMLIAGFIHVAAVNHWESIVEKQFLKLRSSGLLDKTSVIYLGVTGASEEIKTESDILRNMPQKVKIVIFPEKTNRFEFPTLELLQEHCRSNNGYVWYIHTKGVMNAHGSQRAWRNRMEEFVLIHHEIAISCLDGGYMAAAGYGSVDERWPIPGNFWWAQTAHIRSLPDIRLVNQSNRHEAERWIGMNGTQGFYWHDYGGTRFNGWEITSAQTGAGIATTGGYHGWKHIPVLPPKSGQCDVLISAHAPSCVAINNKVTLLVMGFTCGSARTADWKVEFTADGEFLGSARHASVTTKELLLLPGRHRLSVRLTEGERWGAHTAWRVSVVHDSREHKGPRFEQRKFENSKLSPLFGLDTRTGIIQSIIHQFEFKSYLEIGIGNGKNFRAINCAEKVSVDPGGTPVHLVTSDEFFARNTRTFDLIFIDGLHVYETVLRDVENALMLLNPGGAVVCHDMNPADEATQRVPKSVRAWTGDCWRAWVEMRVKRKDCFMTVFDTDYGVGVIIPDARKPNPLPFSPPDPLGWEEFNSDKNELLDLRKPNQAWAAIIEDGWGCGLLTEAP